MNAKDGDMNTLRCAALAACLLILASPRYAPGQDPPFSNDAVSLLPAGEAAAAQTPAEPPGGAAPAIVAPPIEGRTLGSLAEASPLPARAGDAEPAMLGGLPVGEIVRVGGALAIVLGLVLMVRLVLRRGGGLRGSRPALGVLEVLARYPLGKGHQLLLVKLSRRVLLVHQGGGNMTTLTELVDPDEVATLLARIEAGTKGAAAGRFGDLLKRYQREHATPGRWPQASTGSPLRVERPVPEVVDLTKLSRPARGSGA